MSAVLAIVLVFGFFQACAPRAKAQGSAPTWANGDWWEYTGSGQTMGYVYNVVMKQTVAGKQSVAVGGVAYETYHCTLSMSLTMTVMGTTVSVSVNGDSYHRISDLAEVKISASSSYGGSTSTATMTWDPPADGLDFPLSNGKTWSVTTTEVTVSSSGTNTPRVLTYDYTVSGPLTVSVPSGTFDAFNVERRERNRPQNATTNLYYSDAVGNALKMTSPLLGSSMPVVVELKSYYYSTKAFLGGLWWILVIIIVIVVVIATVAVVLYSRSRARLAPPMQPMWPVYGQPPMPQQPYQPPYSPPQQPPYQQPPYRPPQPPP